MSDSLGLAMYNNKVEGNECILWYFNVGGVKYEGDARPKSSRINL